MVQLWHCRAGDLNSVLHVQHTMPAWGIAFQFWGGVIAAAVVVVVQFLLFRCIRFFYQISFDFLDNLIFIYSEFLIFIYLYVQYFIIIVHLFITFLQALVHWHAYESCFVGSSISISLAWVLIRPWQMKVGVLYSKYSLLTS